MGSLPPTYRSTARHDDPISGQRLYRVPVGMLFGSGIKFPELKIGHIDTIQPHLRLMAAWPSIHPKTGQVYRWYTPDGLLMQDPNRNRALREQVNAELYQKLIGHHDQTAPDRLVEARVEAAVVDLLSGTASRYESTRDHVAALTRMRASGRRGGAACAGAAPRGLCAGGRRHPAR